MKRSKSFFGITLSQARHGRRCYHALAGVFASRKLLYIITAGMLLLCSSCGDTSETPPIDDGSLKGTITIQNNYGTDITDAYTGDTLVAVYSGEETVSYQWNWKQSASDPSTNVGTDSDSYMVVKEGSYTVTVSAPGKTSKTSAAVAVINDPSKEDLTGTVLFFIDGETDPVTTSETGQEITALYQGSETLDTDIYYQWFKGEQPVQDYSDISNDKYTPTEPGSYTVTLTVSGYNPFVSDPIAVTGDALLTITFDYNGPSGTNPVIIIAPNTALGALLPAPPEYNGFDFDGWYTEEGTEVDADTSFTESATVSARWIFGGGTAYKEQDDGAYGGYIVVHPNPKVTAVSNATVSTTDGTITLNRIDNNTRGMIKYSWPSGDDFDINEYVYCDVDFVIVGYTDGTGNDPKAGSGIQLMLPDGSENRYPGVANSNPWLTNLTSTGIRFTLAGAGNGGGFAIRSDGQNGGQIEFRITKITFYKLEQFTVSFDLAGAENPTSIADVEVYDGYTLAFNGSSLTSKFPAPPTLTDYTFMGWQNPAGNMVIAATLIRGSWTLTAQWMKTSDLPTPVATAEGNGTLFAASGGSTAAKFDYDGKEWWVFAKTPPGSPAAVAPFNGDAAADYTAALAEATRVYTRVNYSLSTLGGSVWQSFSKVKLTYDLIMVGGSDRSITVRNGDGQGGEPSPGNPAFEEGNDRTITFNISDFGTGNLALVKNNTGVDSLFLLRITKVELTLE